MKAAVITVSDGVTAGTRADTSGDLLAQLLTRDSFELVSRTVVPDEIDAIVAALRNGASAANLVVTTGGTGLGSRDVTPEATASVIDREIPGLSFLMLARGVESTPKAALSRAKVGNVGQTLIVNLPGSPRGVEEGWEAIAGVVEHSLALLSGNTEH